MISVHRDAQSLVDGVGGSTAVRSSWPAGALWNPIKLCYHQCPQERNTGGHGRSGRSSTGKSVTVPAGMLSQSADAAGRKRQANDVSHELLECEAGWLRPRRLGACCGRRRVRCGLGTRGCLGQPADRRCCGLWSGDIRPTQRGAQALSALKTARAGIRVTAMQPVRLAGILATKTR